MNGVETEAGKPPIQMEAFKKTNKTTNKTEVKGAYLSGQ